MKFFLFFISIFLYAYSLELMGSKSLKAANVSETASPVDSIPSNDFNDSTWNLQAKYFDSSVMSIFEKIINLPNCLLMDDGLDYREVVNYENRWRIVFNQYNDSLAPYVFVIYAQVKNIKGDSSYLYYYFNSLPKINFFVVNEDDGVESIIEKDLDFCSGYDPFPAIFFESEYIIMKKEMWVAYDGNITLAIEGNSEVFYVYLADSTCIKYDRNKWTGWDFEPKNDR